MSKLLFEVFLQAAHFQQARIRMRKEGDQEIIVALRMCLSARTRTEQLHARDGMAFAYRTYRRAERLQIRRCWR